MTSAQVVEMSVTNNSSFQNYPHPDDHTIQTTYCIYVCGCMQGLRTKFLDCDWRRAGQFMINS